MEKIEVETGFTPLQRELRIIELLDSFPVEEATEIIQRWMLDTPNVKGYCRT